MGIRGSASIAWSGSPDPRPTAVLTLHGGDA
jgi:hypothetical protein